MIWKTRDRDIDLARHGLVMGVLNVTPDSFSDGGEYFSPERAVEHGLRLLGEGADVLDIGGESTRPGSDAVSAEEEIRRVVPVVQALRVRTPALLSIDTSKASVARAALNAGADIINDVTGLRGDPEMPGVAADSGAGVVLMHMQGTPRTMQQTPEYGDVLGEVGAFFRESLDRASARGIDPIRIALDPGIGFGKTPAHNRRLILGLEAFAALGRPIAIGVSRKSFLGWLAGSDEMERRAVPGLVLTALCRERGARIFRVHEPKIHREALRATEAMLEDV